MPETSPWMYFLSVTWLVLWVSLACIASVHAVMRKRVPTSAVLWIVVCFTLPVVGSWLYWAFGINRIERRAIERLGARPKPDVLPDHAREHIVSDEERERIGPLTALRNVADAVTRLPLLAGNTLTPLHNGENAYPEMLAAIAQAKETVTLTSYIFDWDGVGRNFADALRDAARRGVRVHVLLDGIGAVRTFSRMGRFLMKSGAEVSAFFPLRFPFGRVRLNLRNHRKILVIDGRIGFTGGMNISQRYVLSRTRRGESEDLHFKVTGPVVAELQHAFVEDWFMATDHALSGDAYFPRLERTGGALCRGIDSGPDEDFENIHWVVQGAFAAAQRSVRVVSPYFVPTEALLSAMSMAAMRGVSVSLFLPSFVDLPYMRWAADAYLGQILEHGIKVHLRPPPFVHTKLMIVDERWLLFGSANLDRRSFRLNFEFNVEAYDPELATELASWLDGLVDHSERITETHVGAMPPLARFRNSCVKLLSPYL